MTAANQTTSTNGSESCNAIQGRFDFGGPEGAKSHFALLPLGTWSGHSLPFRLEQHEARLASAGARVLSVVGPSRALFEACLSEEGEALRLQVETQKRGDSEFSLWGSRHVQQKKDEGSLRAFFEHCEAHQGSDYDGIVYKVRHDLGLFAAAMHVPGLGSLTVRKWENFGYGLDFTLIERDTFFLESYSDSRTEIELPYAIWGKASGAQKLAESGNSIASLPTFTVSGREYVQLGSTHTQNRQSGSAWLIGSLADWRGPTFGSYQEHIAAYDAGTVQRGDHRGVLVKVRGVVCVLESAALVFDNDPCKSILIVDEEDELVDDEEFESDEVFC